MKIHCKYTELRKPEDLVEHPKNPNKHEDRQIEALAKIINHQGWRNPIVVSSRSGFVIAGHGRLMAAKKMGAESVPVDIQEFQDEATEYAHMIADNKIAEFAQMDDQTISELLSEIGEDFDLELAGLLNGFDFEVENIDTDPDDFDGEPPEEPTTKLGQVFKLGNHRLMCGDSTNTKNVEKLMNGTIPDLIYTDPPYGMNAVSKSGVLSKNYRNDILGDSTNKTAQDAFLLLNHLYPKSKHVWWGANYYSASLPDSECWLVWDKNNGNSDQTDCELAYTNLRSVVRMFTKSSEKTNRVHPTQKPVELLQWLLKKFKIKASTIADVFGGSGSTIIAAEINQISSFIMELSPAYCDVIIKRWEEYTGGKAELIE